MDHDLDVRIDQPSVLLNDFRDYLLEPYAGDAVRQRGLLSWLEQVRKNAAYTNGVKLSFVQVEHEITKRNFRAFSLDDQMFFSHDAGVMTLPNMRGPNYCASERWVGCWLKAWPEVPASFMETYRLNLALIKDAGRDHVTKDLSNVRSDWLKRISSEIEDGLAHKDFYGDDENFGQGNTIDPRYKQIRISFEIPPYDYWHYDDESVGISAPLDLQIRGGWNRVISYAIEGPGTEYRIGVPQNFDVPCPPYTVSSHLGYVYLPGRAKLREAVSHKAVGDVNGRVNLIMESPRIPLLPEGITSPWHTSTLSSCEFG